MKTSPISAVISWLVILIICKEGCLIFKGVEFLDTEGRIIIEVVPEKKIMFDGGMMRDKTSEAINNR